MFNMECVCCRHLEWIRSMVLPLQEMFGQVGIRRFWDDTPAFPDPSQVSSLFKLPPPFPC